jgi:endonuclease YncB( thermonuclease family)
MGAISDRERGNVLTILLDQRWGQTQSLKSINTPWIDSRGPGHIVKVADSDTITVLDSNRQQHQQVRIAGNDAPEKNQPFRNASRKSFAAMVAGKEVRVEFDMYDRYGRIVGRMLVISPDCPTCGKTLDVGLAQIITGMAWWYRYFAHEPSV